MKHLLPLLLFCFITQIHAQELYDDFEGNKLIKYGYSDGRLDTIYSNPDTNNINKSSNCARYIRTDSMLYDNMKIFPDGRMDASSYASTSVMAPRIKMKVFTTDTPGTVIEIQLGKRGDDMYPSGVHSEYRAVTSVQNEWEELTFTFVQKPAGSTVTDSEVDKMVVLFAPNTANNDTFYFDDLLGPELLNVGISNKTEPIAQVLYQNTPNPANKTTTIKYFLPHDQQATLKLFDLLGKNTSTIVNNKKQVAGTHEIVLDTGNLPEGVYFYSLQTNAGTITRKLLISR